MMGVSGLSRGIDGVAAAAVLGRAVASVTAGFVLPVEMGWWRKVRYR